MNSDQVPHIWGETTEGYNARVAAHLAHVANRIVHNCGRFDTSYIRITSDRPDVWVIWCGEEPEINAEFCPYCGVNLQDTDTRP